MSTTQTPSSESKYQTSGTSGNLFTVLHAELRSLSTEARRRNPDLKDAADNTIMVLRSLQSSQQLASAAEEATALRKAGEPIVRPFLLGCNSGNVKLAALSLSSLQKLVSYGAVAEECVGSVGDAAAALVKVGDDTVRLKLLQLALVILTSSAYSLSHTLLPQLLAVCFQLHTVRSPAVTGTAAATLRQAGSVLMDRAAGAGDDASEVVREVKNAYLFVRDLIHVADGDTGRWLAVSAATESRYLVLELLDSILSHHGDTIRRFPSFIDMLRDKTATFVVRALRDSTEFPIVLRLFRLLAVLIRGFTSELGAQTEVLLTAAVREVEGGENIPVWRRILATEAVRSVCGDSDLFVLLYCRHDANPDQPVSLVANTVSAVARALQTQLPQHGSKSVSGNNAGSGITGNGSSSTTATATTTTSSPASSMSMSGTDSILSAEAADTLPLARTARRSPRLDLLSATSPFTPARHEHAAVCMCVLVDVVSSVGKVSGLEKDRTSKDSGDTDHNQDNNDDADDMADNNNNNNKDKNLTSQPHANEEVIGGRLCECVWCAVLAGLSAVLDSSRDEETMQQVLRAYQTFTHCCGAASLPTPRDAFLTDLCKRTLPPTVPPHQPNSATTNNTHSSNNNNSNSTTNTTGNNNTHRRITPRHLQAIKALFNVASCLGEVLGSSWFLVLKHLDHVDALLSGPSPPADPSELSILSSALENLFQSTQFLSTEALRCLVKALASVSRDTLSATSSNAMDGVRLFALDKMVETVRINATRLVSVWPDVRRHLLEAAEHSSPVVRRAAVDAASAILLRVLDDDSKISEESRECVLRLLPALYASGDEDVREATLSVVYAAVEASGERMGSGWTVVIPMLMTTTSTYPAGVPNAFRTVQLLCSDFVHLLDAQTLIELIKTIGRYAQHHADDVNISLSALPLLWNVADHVATLPKDQEEAQNLWLEICQQHRETALDERFEVRNSALRTLAATLSTHGSHLEPETWQKVLEDILLPALADVQHTADTASDTPPESQSHPSHGGVFMHHSRNTAAKQWSETRCLAIEGVVRIFASFGDHLQSVLPSSDSFASLADRLASLLVEDAVCGVEEVGQVTVRALATLSDVSAIVETISPSLWRVRNALAQHAGDLNMDIAAQLVQGSGEVADANTLDDLLKVCVVAGTSSIGRQTGWGSSGLSAIQDAILDVLKSIAADNLDPTDTDSFHTLFTAYHNLITVDPPLPPVFTAALLQCMTAAFRDAGEAVHGREFGHVLNTVGQCLQAPEHAVWKVAVPALISMLEDTLPGLDTDAAIQEKDWRCLCDTVYTFIVLRGEEDENGGSGESVNDVHNEDEARERDEDAAAVVRCIGKTVLPHSSSAPPDARLRLVEDVLQSASRLSPRPLATAALECLFSLVDADTHANATKKEALQHVGRHALSVVLERCREILREYVKEDRRTGLCPVPRFRREEVARVLEVMRKVSVAPYLFPTDEDDDGDQANNDDQKTDRWTLLRPVMSGPHGIMMRLFPVLCECITCTDPDIKKELQSMFRTVSLELGLEPESGFS